MNRFWPAWHSDRTIRVVCGALALSLFLRGGLRAEISPGVVKIDLRDPERGAALPSAVNYVPLADVATALHLQWAVDPATRVHSFQGPGLVGALCPGIAMLLVNGQYRLLGGPVLYLDGQTQVPSEITEMLRSQAAQPTEPPREVAPIIPRIKKREPCTIVVDAGHGGKDPGAIGPTGLQEKEIALDVATKLKSLLSLQGHQVILTRSTDRFLALKERTDICRREQPDLFVAIHFNANSNRSITGFESYYSDSVLTLDTKDGRGVEPGDLNRRRKETQTVVSGEDTGFFDTLFLQEFHHEGKRLAASLQRALTEAIAEEPNRGVRPAPYYVVRYSQAPAALVELGFLSNGPTEKLLRTPAHRNRLAEALCRGIEQFLYAP
jgi:N-acetylmuramoyl-L-alanine amidase